jgi:hypothetical protein
MGSRSDATDKQLKTALTERKIFVGAYFARHHEDFESQRLAWPGTVTQFWAVASEIFREEQIVGAQGEPLGPKSLRRTWDRYQAKHHSTKLPKPGRERPGPPVKRTSTKLRTAGDGKR